MTFGRKDYEQQGAEILSTGIESFCSADAIIEVVIRMARDNSSRFASILDVGCGAYPSYSREIAAMGKRVHGVDFSFNYLRLESTLQVLSGARGVPWEINGVTFRIDPRCRAQLGSNYEAEVAHFLSKRIKPGAICFDVGANVGAYALQLSHWTGPTGKVVAFEPNPIAIQALTEHVQFNGFERIVDIEQAAVASHPATRRCLFPVPTE